QTPMLGVVNDAWDLDAPGAVVEELDAALNTRADASISDNFGNINEALTRTYPHDRFLMTAFMEDLNFSMFSFAAISMLSRDDPNFTESILTTWREELERFTTHPSTNDWGYYFPQFRPDFCSHMVATAAFSK